ncbi:DNA recombination protein RmuC [hydrothermal vent metagenome]|uniref:DNA recombination protein RmuC n=1 Tax=hydrothermal vent metagenome TaxID=652676 RepID=A0A3B1C813_9ZZZZ
MEYNTTVIVALALLGVIAGAVITAIYFARAKNGKPEDHFATIEKVQEKSERALREELALVRRAMDEQAKNGRDESRDAMKKFGDSILSRMAEIASLQTTNLSRLTESNETKLEKMRETVEARLKSMQDDNNQKLEKMRVTVDEKLNDTLEKRLGSSFKQVRDQLDQLHKGLGEMQSLASGVDELKRTLSNVKSRGVWGEVSLGALLEQTLSDNQYAKNVATTIGSAERVEFAIKLPGAEADNNDPVWLPIDAKFPLEDYQRLVEAQEASDKGAIETAGKALETRIKAEAKKIQEKYINPPRTTDFAVMYLPTEGLYAEVLKRPGVWDTLQREYRVSIAGPTTLTALLNSLRMGFRSLAVQKRASDVWRILDSVKTEFGKFGEAVARTRQKLDEASSSIDKVETRTRVLTKKLNNAQELGDPENKS